MLPVQFKIYDKDEYFFQNFSDLNELPKLGSLFKPDGFESEYVVGSRVICFEENCRARVTLFSQGHGLGEWIRSTVNRKR